MSKVDVFAALRQSSGATETVAMADAVDAVRAKVGDDAAMVAAVLIGAAAAISGLVGGSRAVREAARQLSDLADLRVEFEAAQAKAGAN